jgi:hypothetical protein
MDFEATINGCITAIERDARNNLSYSFRKQVWRDVGRHKPARSPEQVHQASVRLAILSIEKVASIWNSALPDDDTVDSALAMTQKLIHGVCTADGERECGRIWSYCDDLVCHYPDRQHAIAVGYGAAQAVHAAVTPGFLSSNAECDDDDVMDPYDLDPAFFGSVAYAGGTIWDPESDDQKRRDYWLWWLNTAMQIALADDSKIPLV